MYPDFPWNPADESVRLTSIGSELCGSGAAEEERDVKHR
jgi:hypothetical protein